MFKKMKLLKDQRGLTLVELLVVVVILGILSAIAIPSVGGLIENSRKDAMVANAQQAINSAKLYFATNSDSNSITLEGPNGLVSGGYLEAPADPWDRSDGTLTGTIFKATNTTTGVTTYSIYLTNGKTGAALKYVGTSSTAGESAAIPEHELARDSVNKTAPSET